MLTRVVVVLREGEFGLATTRVYSRVLSGPRSQLTHRPCSDKSGSAPTRVNFPSPRFSFLFTAKSPPTHPLRVVCVVALAPPALRTRRIPPGVRSPSPKRAATELTRRVAVGTFGTLLGTRRHPPRRHITYQHPDHPIPALPRHP